MQEHAKEFWNLNPEEASEIKADKIDVATDLSGSFLPDSLDPAYETISGLMHECVLNVLGTESSNFLTLGKLLTIDTQPAANTIGSCFQY